MPQHSTWDDDEIEITIHDNGEGDDDDTTDWDDFDRSIRSDDAHWHERVGAGRD